VGVGAGAESDAPVTDRIVLTLPSDARFRGVGTLVLAGIGARLDVPYERMDDLQLALLSALEAAGAGEVTLEIDADAEALRLAVGPLRPGSATDRGLDAVLSRLADQVEYQNRGESGEWVALRIAAERPD